MHKLAIHTNEAGLAKLHFINREHIVEAGYHKVNARILSGDGRGASATIKMDLFLSTLPADVISLLESEESIEQFTLTQCSKTSLFEEMLSEELPEEKVVSSTSAGDDERMANHPSSSHDTEIEVKELPTGKLKLTMKSGQTTYFLVKVIGVLANNDIPLYKAQTFPQSDHIVGTFEIPRINGEHLAYVENEICQELAASTMGSCGYKKFSRAEIPADELHISMGAKGAMPSLKVICEKNDILSRFTILEAISLFDQEITISRMGGLGKKIEDTYYVKPIKGISLSMSIIEQIIQHITGTKQ